MFLERKIQKEERFFMIMTEEYKQSNTPKEDCGTLHMFFSPAPIPKGLTTDEVSVCVALYETMADYMRRKYGLRDISEHPNHPLLPDELICNGEPMTRERFLKGIDKLLTRISDS